MFAHHGHEYFDMFPTFYFILFYSLNSFGCIPGNKTEFLQSASLTEEAFQENPIINWDAILYVSRPTELWAVQFVLALISLTEAMLITYLGYKVSIFDFQIEWIAFQIPIELQTSFSSKNNNIIWELVR